MGCDGSESDTLAVVKNTNIPLKDGPLWTDSRLVLLFEGRPSTPTWLCTIGIMLPPLDAMKR